MYGVREHTADLIIWAEARDQNAAVEQAAKALRYVVTGKGQPLGNPDVERTFRVEAPDQEALLVAFFSELLWLQESEDLLWHSGGVTVEEGSMQVTCNMVRYDPVKHGQGVEVKAVTYHDLEFARRGDRWHVGVLLDI